MSTGIQLRHRHRLAVLLILRWPRRLNELIQSTMFWGNLSWVVLLGLGSLMGLGAGLGLLTHQLRGYPIENAIFAGAACGIGVGCLIVGWMAVGLAIGGAVESLARREPETPRVKRAREMLRATQADLLTLNPTARHVRFW